MNRCGGSIFTVFFPSLEAKWRTKTFAMNIHGTHNHNNDITVEITFTFRSLCYEYPTPTQKLLEYAHRKRAPLRSDAPMAPSLTPMRSQKVPSVGIEALLALAWSECRSFFRALS